VLIDNDRWRGVPFYLRTGKQLAQGRRVITIAYKEPEIQLFPLWEVATPLLERPPGVARYAPGSWGPASVNQLIAPRRWHLPEDGR